jgi:uncharacterized protein (TIGR00730 family)
MIQTLTEWQFLLLEEMKREYEQGMLALNSLPAQTVTFYGGARIKPGTSSFNQTFEMAKSFAERGWGVVSGGGPGIMEASIKGAQAGASKSVAFRIDLPNEQRQVDADIDVLFKHFNARKYMLRQSDVFVYAPGGIGTLDELMENLTLVSTGKHPKKNIFLLDSKFWKGYVGWIEEMLFTERGTVSQELLSCYTLVDTTEEVMTKLYADV